MSDLICNICLCGPLAIAAFTIASHYDPLLSACSDTEYTVDPTLYLHINGWLNIACIGLSCFNCLCGSEDMAVILVGFGILGTILNVVLGVLGIVIYAEMNDECHTEPIAKMTLSLGIIDSLATLCLCGAITCLFCTVCMDGVLNPRNPMTGRQFHPDFHRQSSLQRTKSIYNAFNNNEGGGGRLNSFYKAIYTRNKDYGSFDDKDDGDLSEDTDFDDIPRTGDQDNNNNEKDPLV